MILIQWLFLIPLITSTFIVLSASSPVYIWMALEINTIVFIPIMIVASKPESIRRAIKYFFVQAFASLIFIIGPIFSSVSFFITFFTAIIMKLGASPFHNWFPSVISNTSWSGAFILSTWQKIAPLSLLIENISNNNFIILIASINAIVGGLGGLAQREIRPLLAFSSIGHIGWLVYSINFSHFLTFIYFISYTLHLLVLIFILSKIDTHNLKDPSSTNFSNKLWKFMIPFILISLGGLPPLLGFIPKFIIINLATLSSIVPLILILGSYINIYYYINLIWASYMSNFESSSISINQASITNLFILIIVTIFIMVSYGLNIYLQP